MKNNIKSYFISGTDAFDKIFKGLKLPKDSEVIVPVTLCESVINIIIKNDLKPVFVDVDDSFLIGKFEDKITPNTKVIIFVEQYGFIYKLEKRYYNKNGEKIISIIDSCQSKIKRHSNYDYVIYSFNKNKPIDLGKYALVISNHKIKGDIRLPIKKHIKLFLKRLIYSIGFLRKKYIVYLIKKRIHIPGVFIDNKNDSYHRIIFVMNIDIEKFIKFEELLYEYLNKYNCNLIETTIEKLPFEKLKIKDSFNNINQLRTKTIYFRSTGKIKEYKKILNYINEVYYEKI